MRIIAVSTLKAFWENNPACLDAKEPLLAWHKFALQVVWINYQYRIVYIRFVGTHAQYDAIDPKTV